METQEPGFLHFTTYYLNDCLVWGDLEILFECISYYLNPGGVQASLNQYD